MKGFLSVAVLVFVVVAGWQVGQTIDPDVVLIVIGFVFGTLAAIPVGLLMLVSQRRKDGDDGPRRGGRGGGYSDYPPMAYPPQQQPFPALPAPQPNPWTVTGGGAFDDMPAPRQDGRFRMGGAK